MKFSDVILGVEGISDDIISHGSGETEEEAIWNHNEYLGKLIKRIRHKYVEPNKKMKLYCGKKNWWYLDWYRDKTTS